MTRRRLHHLARLHGVQVQYRDGEGIHRTGSDEAIFATLRALGCEVNGWDGVEEAIRQRRRQLWQRRAEPVHVAWDDDPSPHMPLRLPEQQRTGAVRCRLDLESGESREWRARLDELPVIRRRRIEGDAFVRLHLALPAGLPWGYHDLTLHLPDETARCRLIVAPRRADAEPIRRGRRWGLFIPLHALHREPSWGAGDLSDLRALMQWTAEEGGGAVAHLPMLATGWELGEGPNPYTPISRLFPDDLYLDPTRIPGFEACERAQQLVRKAEANGELAALRSAKLVDYRRLVALKRRVLAALADAFFERQTGEREAFDRFCRQRPELRRFARFRAVMENRGEPWFEWPQRLQGGAIEEGEFDRRDERYHLFVQWRLDQQLDEAATAARRAEVLWYIDLPLGVSGSAYDVWRDPELFVRPCATGAPPDPMFPTGQEWGLPPVHPERSRLRGHRYFIECVRAHVQRAGILRVDHVMSLHRLYWIPRGRPATDGLYVRYPMEELIAVLLLESNRSRTAVIGEDIGTVPDAIRQAMARHGILGTFAVQPTLDGDAENPAPTPDAHQIAMLNTHDMPPFAAYWNGEDIDDRLDLGWIDRQQAANARKHRRRTRDRLAWHLSGLGYLDEPTEQRKPVLEALLTLLADSPSPLLIVNLEDLLGETRPQNVPGTSTERPNWRNRAAQPLEQIERNPTVQRLLAALRERRPAAQPETEPAERGV